MRPYFFHINVYDLASMAILFSGLTLALLLGFTKRTGQLANLLLSSGLGVVAIKTGGLTSIFLPALGPLLYFYTRQRLCPERRFNKSLRSE